MSELKIFVKFVGILAGIVLLIAGAIGFAIAVGKHVMVGLLIFGVLVCAYRGFRQIEKDQEKLRSRRPYTKPGVLPDGKRTLEHYNKEELLTKIEILKDDK